MVELAPNQNPNLSPNVQYGVRTLTPNTKAVHAKFVILRHTYFYMRIMVELASVVTIPQVVLVGGDASSFVGWCIRVHKRG